MHGLNIYLHVEIDSLEVRLRCSSGQQTAATWRAGRQRKRKQNKTRETHRLETICVTHK